MHQELSGTGLAVWRVLRRERGHEEMRQLSGKVRKACAAITRRAASGFVTASPMFFFALSVLVAVGVVLSALLYSSASNF